MICPNCHTSVPDDALRCPACRADLYATTQIPRLKGTWCATCGALVPDGADVCPGCGTPVVSLGALLEEGEPLGTVVEGEGEGPSGEAPEAGDVPEAEPKDEASAPAYELPRPRHARIEEAEGATHTKPFLVAALASLVIVGGTVLAITHPWNPTDRHAHRPAGEMDTSQAGSLGTLETLSGQEGSSDGEKAAPKTADELAYEALTDAYAEMLDLRERIGSSDAGARALQAGTMPEVREAGAAEALQAGLDLSNLIAGAEQIDVSSGTYKADKKELLRLANTLRNWSDTVCAAWEAALDTEEGSFDPARVQELIERDDVDGENGYAAIFDEEAPRWSPSAP